MRHFILILIFLTFEMTAIANQAQNVKSNKDYRTYLESEIKELKGRLTRMEKMTLEEFCEKEGNYMGCSRLNETNDRLRVIETKETILSNTKRTIKKLEQKLRNLEKPEVQ